MNWYEKIFLPLLLLSCLLRVSSGIPSGFAKLVINQASIERADFFAAGANSDPACRNWFMAFNEYIIKHTTFSAGNTQPWTSNVDSSLMYWSKFGGATSFLSYTASGGEAHSAENVLKILYRVSKDSHINSPVGLALLESSAQSTIAMACRNAVDVPANIFPNIFLGASDSLLPKTSIKKLFDPAYRNVEDLDDYRHTVYCSDGSVISNLALCDNEDNCPDAADEDSAMCGYGSQYGFLVLAEGSQYAAITQICSGNVETYLDDNEDELLTGMNLFCDCPTADGVCPPTPTPPPTGLKAFYRSPYFRVYIAAKRRAAAKYGKEL